MAALIFDFDGVIADSEVVANKALAEFLSELGFPCSTEDCLGRYAGLAWNDALPLIERDIGGHLPQDFLRDLRKRIYGRFDEELVEVEGVTTFIDRFLHIPRCIASSRSLKGITHSLSLLDMDRYFGEFLFSAEQVTRGKPHPDLFLFAAGQMQMAPGHCLVIEDSVNGVKAAAAAGMAVIGLCAGSHIRDGHAERLKEAGAHYVARTWDEAAAIAEEFIRTR